MLRFSRHVRDLGSTHTALQEALECYPELNEEAVQVCSDGASNNAQRSELQRARLRLDAVTMNLERRHVGRLVRNPELLQSLHVYSDGSPVTGSEIQGIVMWTGSYTIHRDYDRSNILKYNFGEILFCTASFFQFISKLGY